MRKRFFARLLLSVSGLFILISAAAAQSPQPGFADAALGRWDLTVQGPDGPYPSWLEIMLRKETELMGRFVGRFGSMRHLTQIQYRDGELTFRVPVQYEQNSSDLVFKGRLTGDRLEGTTEGADGKTLTWMGTRAPALIRATPPKWGKPIKLFNGKDLSGWKLRGSGRGDCWKVENGTLVNNVPCVDIISEQKFSDF
ncbi:MAG TPA: family 16 glycoside hydrolase, partial [Blastocatellia bacterium]|nr:family 16 glycoside hydrolase [Blastocatellia bacterium]